MNGIFVASTVMKWMFTSSGNPAECLTFSWL